MIRGAPAGAERSGARTTAAAPSVNELHMSRVRTPATWGEASTSSKVTSCWIWASGLRLALRRALTAAEAICSTVAPRSSMNWRAQPSLRAMRTLPAGFPSARKAACTSAR